MFVFLGTRFFFQKKVAAGKPKYFWFLPAGILEQTRSKVIKIFWFFFKKELLP